MHPHGKNFEETAKKCTITSTRRQDIKDQRQTTDNQQTDYRQLLNGDEQIIKFAVIDGDVVAHIKEEKEDIDR